MLTIPPLPTAGLHYARWAGKPMFAQFRGYAGSPLNTPLGNLTRL